MNIHIHAKAAGILNRQLSCKCGCLSSYNTCRNIVARLIHCQVNVLNLREIFILQILTTDTHCYTIYAMECNRYIGTLNGIQYLLRNLYLTGTYHVHVNRCNRRILCNFCNLILYRTAYFIPVHSLRSRRSACTVRAIIIAIIIFRLTINCVLLFCKDDCSTFLCCRNGNRYFLVCGYCVIFSIIKICKNRSCFCYYRNYNLFCCLFDIHSNI